MKNKLKLLFLSFLVIPLYLQGNLMDKIQNIDALMQAGKYTQAENEASRLLTDPNITDQERASVQNLLTEIRSRAKNREDVNADNSNISQNEIDTIIAEALNEEEEIVDVDPDLPAALSDVSTIEKYRGYDSYEKQILSSLNANTIYQMVQIYFRDGLYERAVNIAKKDRSGDLRNLYAVAIGSRLIGLYDQSIEYYNKILRNSPNQAEAKLGMAVAYKSKGDFHRALTYLREYASVYSSSEVNRAISELNRLTAQR